MESHKELKTALVGTMRAAIANSLKVDESIKKLQKAGSRIKMEDILHFLGGFELPDSKYQSLLHAGRSGQLRLNAEDLKFLGSLKISIDDLENQ